MGEVTWYSQQPYPVRVSDEHRTAWLDSIEAIMFDPESVRSGRALFALSHEGHITGHAKAMSGNWGPVSKLRPYRRVRTRLKIEDQWHDTEMVSLEITSVAWENKDIVWEGYRRWYHNYPSHDVHFSLSGRILAIGTTVFTRGTLFAAFGGVGGVLSKDTETRNRHKSFRYLIPVPVTNAERDAWLQTCL